MALTVMKNKTKLFKMLFIAECLSYCFHNMKDVKQYFHQIYNFQFIPHTSLASGVIYTHYSV